MANPPEHDFAPSWLKIPQGGQYKSTLDPRSSHKVNYPQEQYHSHDRHRRVDSFPGFLRSPHNPSSFPRGGHGQRGRDERRQYAHPSRQHSADDIPPMTDHLSAFPHPFNQYTGFPSETPFFPNNNQFRGGRFNGTSRDMGSPHDGYSNRGHNRSGRHHSGGRQRFPSGNSTSSKERGSRSDQSNGYGSKSSHPDDRGKNSSRGGKDEGEGAEGRSNGKGEKGGSETSALSTHDFPSLSGGKVETKEASKPLQPSGVWEKPPGTTKVNIGGRNFTLTSKTSLKEDSSTSKAKTAPSTSPPSSASSSPRSLISSNSSTGTPLSLKLSSQTSGSSVEATSSHGIIPIISNNGGGSTIKVLVPAKVTSTKTSITAKTSSRKPQQKEGGTRPVSGTANKDKPPPPLINNTNATVKEIPPSKPSPTAPLDIPAPRLIVAKSKKGDKNDFLKELRRSNNGDGQQMILVNGSNLEEDHNISRASIHISDSLQTDNKFIVDNTNRSTTNIPVQNGYLTSNDSWENTLMDSTPNKLSSSLEAEQRLLREMGWHEHSDNEEGYAPITEDELKEFRLKTEQLKKNGVTRPNMINLHLSSMVNCITSPMSHILDDLSSSDSETSDDED